jgi:hypothetical protein
MYYRISAIHGGMYSMRWRRTGGIMPRHAEINTSDWTWSIQQTQVRIRVDLSLRASAAKVFGQTRYLLGFAQGQFGSGAGDFEEGVT